MQLVIRRFRPSDTDTVLDLFSIGILEHIRPCFYNAMSSPEYLAVTVALGAAGFLLGSALGCVALGCVALPAAWLALVYYACHQLYSSYVQARLRTDMRDIPGNFLSRPDDCFWVAEAQLDGVARVVGMVAVVTKQSGTERCGELFRMIISPRCRRAGLGQRLTQTVLEFCEQRGIPRVELETSSTQQAAVALYTKLGFIHVLSHTRTEAPIWIVKLAKVTVIKMEKHLKKA